MELSAFDTLLRWLPKENQDTHIVLVGIETSDIEEVGSYPIPDGELVKLLKKLKGYDPAVIGLSLVRDIPVEPGHKSFISLLQNTDNIFVIAKATSPQINPPEGMSSKRVGFDDFVADPDGLVRRTFLGISPTGIQDDFKFSFSFLLADAFLRTKGELKVGNGKFDPYAVQLSFSEEEASNNSSSSPQDIEIPRISPSSGGYSQTAGGGVQTLLNYTRSDKPFLYLSMGDIKSDDFDPDQLRGRIIIIGMTDPASAKFVSTSVGTSAIYHQSGSVYSGLIYGLEFQAHAVSQIISSALYNRPFLNTWPNFCDYLWLLCWGIIGMILGQATYSTTKNLVTIIVAIVSLVGICYSLLLFSGLWLPLMPTLFILAINGITYATLYPRTIELSRSISERERTIEQAAKLIHNGPLQNLSITIRGILDNSLLPDSFVKELESIKYELQSIDEYLQTGAVNKENYLYIRRGVSLDLSSPLHELLYLTYSSTIGRNLPGFKDLSVESRRFESIDEEYLDFDQKRDICRFLEEALCNVGKHARGSTRVEVEGINKNGWYTLYVRDNGPGISSSRKGKGSRYCLNTAKRLGGKFRREILSPKGTLCELSWPLRKRYL